MADYRDTTYEEWSTLLSSYTHFAPMRSQDAHTGLSFVHLFLRTRQVLHAVMARWRG